MSTAWPMAFFSAALPDGVTCQFERTFVAIGSFSTTPTFVAQSSLVPPAAPASSVVSSSPSSSGVWMWVAIASTSARYINKCLPAYARWRSDGPGRIDWEMGWFLVPPPPCHTTEQIVRFFFHTQTDSRHTDTDGAEYGSYAEARKAAIQTCGQMMRDAPGAFWESRPGA